MTDVRRSGARQRGYTLTELLVSMALVSLILVAMVGFVLQGQDVAERNESRTKLHDNVRVTVNRLARDLRMIGFGVPQGAQVGGSGNWMPSIFHASPTAIGFRADADGSWVSLVCTPLGSSSSCPRNELYLSSIAYYDSLGCNRPDDPSYDLPLVVVHERDIWQPATCSAIDTANGHLTVTANVADATFIGGQSAVLTVEQVYYRYTAVAQPPYGRLERYVRYDNAPSDTFPPSSVTWTLVADHLTDFWLEYRDAAGNLLSGNPLTAADRAAVSSVGVFVEGFDDPGARNQPQVFQAESRVMVRNAI